MQNAKQSGTVGDGAELRTQKIPDGIRSAMKAEKIRPGMPMNRYPAGQNVSGIRAINRIATVRQIPFTKAKTGHHPQFPVRINIRVNVKQNAGAQWTRIILSARLGKFI